MKQIEILYFQTCPGWRGTVERVHEVIKEEGLDDEVTVKTVSVDTEQDAMRLQFLGSPTVRVDGRDVDPTAASKTDFGLQCRLYESGGRIEKLPSSEMIRTALGLTEVGR